MPILPRGRRCGFHVQAWIHASPVRLGLLPALPASIGANLALTAGDDVQASAVSYGADTLAGCDAVRGNVGAAISEAFLGARNPAAVVRISKSSAAIVTGGGW